MISIRIIQHSAQRAQAYLILRRLSKTLFRSLCSYKFKNRFLKTLPMPLKVKAVLFDLDGTLVDTFEAFHIMINSILRRFNIPERSFRENARLV
ncbi:MAG: hypothetical protein QW334_02320, partial [Thermofilum sp.]